MLALSPNTDCLSVIFALLHFRFWFGVLGVVFGFVFHVKLGS